MTQKKVHIPVPPELVAEVLFKSDATCCRCHVPDKSVQTHHINDDPADNRFENLAVLCLECHDQTQIRGGFGRRLNANLVTRYRDDWLKVVQMKRATEAFRYTSTNLPEMPYQVSAPAAGHPTQAPNSRASGNDDLVKSELASQLFRFAGELDKQEQLTVQITAKTQSLTDIVTEYSGALKRYDLRTRTAIDPSSNFKAGDELAEELVPIVTRYSAHAYSIRSLDNERVRGIQTQIEIAIKIPRDQWTDAVLRSLQARKDLADSRLASLNDLQMLYVSTNGFKGKSSRLDRVLQHMLDAMMQELSTRALYESLRQKLYNLGI